MSAPDPARSTPPSALAAWPTATLAALLLAACAGLPPLRAAAPGQAVSGDPRAASAEAGGLRLTAWPDDWRGWPQDVPDHLTPVAVVVENRGSAPLDLAPDDLALVLPDGRRLPPLPPAQLRDHLRQRGPGALQPVDRAGLPELSPVQIRPAVPRRWSWWEEPWARPPATPVAQAPEPLPAGGSRALLLFYPVPATALGRLALELRAPGGEAGPRVEFARGLAGG